MINMNRSIYMVKAAFFACTLAFSGTALSETKFVFISHAPDADSWWNTIKNATRQAGDDFGIRVDYRNPPNGDLSDMARIIEQAAVREYDGVITTIADYDVLKNSLKAVTDKGIPLITVNSGTYEQSESLGAIMHVGQPEYVAGKGAGEKAKEAGIKTFLCVNHYATNPASFERCRGFGDALGVDFKSSTIDTGEDPIAVQNKVTTFLRKNPETGAILTLGPASAHPTLKALTDNGKLGQIWFATFDLSEDIAKSIKKDEITFGIDQQPYLQGYIPVVVLSELLAKKMTGELSEKDFTSLHEAVKANAKAKERFESYGLVPNYGKRHINSGPGFVTKANIAKVEKFAGKYR